VGISSFPIDGRDPESLIAKANAAVRGETSAVKAVAPIVADAAMQQLYSMVDRVAVAEINVLIMGETGVGKSTLIRMLLALVSPDKGCIRFYTDNETVTASPQTRCNIVYVPQGNSLMSGTIRENLLLGNPKATETQIRVTTLTSST
jgi:ABC-type transport system involved in cytochrome bd biosynthesis fused ATPase/permease subunit